MSEKLRSNYEAIVDGITLLGVVFITVGVLNWGSSYLRSIAITTSSEVVNKPNKTQLATKVDIGNFSNELSSN